MIISCPTCAARYELAGDESTLPPGGRPMRCSRCGHIWHAYPTEGQAEILPPVPAVQDPPVPAVPAGETDSPREQAQLVPDPSLPSDTGGDDGHAPAEADAGLRARLAAQRAMSGRPARPGWRALHGFMIGLCLAAMAAIIQYRDNVVRALPASADLYAAIGLPVNLRGLDFRDIAPRRSFEEGLPVLVVEGDIANVRDERMPVPAVRVSVRGSGSEELYAWTVEPAQSALDAAGTMRFRTKLAAPPRGAEEVLLRFVERTRPSPGMRP